MPVQKLKKLEENNPAGCLHLIQWTLVKVIVKYEDLEEVSCVFYYWDQFKTSSQICEM